MDKAFNIAFKSKRKTTGFKGIATFYDGIVNTHKIYRR